jgi:hypothetical protein
MASRTAASVAGSAAAAGSRAPSPHSTRSGRGPAPSVRCSSTWRAATSSSSSTGDVPGGTRTSTWRAAMSRASPVAGYAGSAIGATTATAATAASTARCAPLPSRASSVAMAAFARPTTNVTPHTPASAASGNVRRFGACETPSDPQVKPPSGHIPRSHSMAVQAPAANTASTIGRSARHIAPTRSPNRATQAAHNSTSAVQAIVPNSAIQYSVAPKNPTPHSRPYTAPRRAPAVRRISSSGTRPTKAIGHRPTGGNASEVARPAPIATAQPTRMEGRPLTRSRGRASSCDPRAGCGA